MSAHRILQTTDSKHSISSLIPHTKKAEGRYKREAQWLKALSALPENPDWIPSNHITTHKSLSSCMRSTALYRPPQKMHVHGTGVHMQATLMHIHLLKKNLKRKREEFVEMSTIVHRRMCTPHGRQCSMVAQLTLTLSSWLRWASGKRQEHQHHNAGDYYGGQTFNLTPASLGGAVLIPPRQLFKCQGGSKKLQMGGGDKVQC